MILDAKGSAAAEHIWSVSRGTMYHAAYDVLQNAADAEDAVGDAMERICRNLSKFDGLPPERIRALAMIYARNIAIDLYRRRQKQPYPLGDWNPEDNPEMAVGTGDAGDAESAVEGAYLTELVEELLAKMPCAMRDVLSLRITFDFSDAEIASVLGIREGTVRTRLHRARAWLKEALSEKGVIVDG